MRLSYIVSVLITIISPVCSSYEKILDTFDVDPVIKDNKNFDAYIACLLDKHFRPCSTLESTDFKNLFGEIVGTACADCSDKQAEIVKKIMFAIINKRPEKLLEFLRFYDPEEEYAKKFAAFLFDREDGVNILDMYIEKYKEPPTDSTPSPRGYYGLYNDITKNLLISEQ